jgi:hypothetical protein
MKQTDYQVRIIGQLTDKHIDRLLMVTTRIAERVTREEQARELATSHKPTA